MIKAVTTNIESQEFQRRQIDKFGSEEHPRAGTTDDVECFFSLYHHKLGLTFTLREFKYQWRKICRYYIVSNSHKHVYMVEINFIVTVF